MCDLPESLLVQAVWAVTFLKFLLHYFVANYFVIPFTVWVSFPTSVLVGFWEHLSARGAHAGLSVVGHWLLAPQSRTILGHMELSV